jgi:hypothetical protein
VRFINLIPLGYLNIVGCEIYFVFGVEELLLFLLGKKLMKIIDIFVVVFMLVLEFSFYSLSSGTLKNRNYLEKYVSDSPFLDGLILSSLNFLQLLFWMESIFD